MNSAVSAKIDLILKHAQPSIQGDLSRHLLACGFTDPDDPALNALVAQAMIAGQPVRLVEAGGAAVATEAGMARLGDRLENTAWSLLHQKVRNVVLSCVLCLALGAGMVLAGFKLWPHPLAQIFDLPRATDARLVTLSTIGATLHVEEAKGTIYVYFDGQPQPYSGQTKGGMNYLYFKP